MLDLQKYLKKAAADPGFRARLLKNPNQAIKDEFGENLPYQLKCKEKLVFEVALVEGFSDDDATSVAGGEGNFQNLAPAPLFDNHYKSENVCLAAAPPILNDDELGGVAGGSGTEEEIVICDDSGVSPPVNVPGPNPSTNPPKRYGRLVYGAARNRRKKNDKPLPMLEDMIKEGYTGPIGNQ